MKDGVTRTHCREEPSPTSDLCKSKYKVRKDVRKAEGTEPASP